MAEKLNPAVPARPVSWTPRRDTVSSRSGPWDLAGPGAGGPQGEGAALSDVAMPWAFGLPVTWDGVPQPEVGPRAARLADGPDPDAADPAALAAWQSEIEAQRRATPASGDAAAAHAQRYATLAPAHGAGEQFTLTHPQVGTLDVHAYQAADGRKLLLRCDDATVRTRLLDLLAQGMGEGSFDLEVAVPLALRQPRDGQRRAASDDY